MEKNQIFRTALGDPGSPSGSPSSRHRFLGIELLAHENVLVPREETELLGREVLAALQARSLLAPDAGLRMIDMGCGSGNIACALAVAVPRLRVWASDLTEACASLTLRNVALHGIEARVEVSLGDLFAPLAGRGLEGTMDVVVMNPPYIPGPSLVKSHAALLLHEPREAFDGGPYGVSVLSRLLREAPPFLKPGGQLLFEFGTGQARIVQALAARAEAFTETRLALDADGEPRVAILTRHERPSAVGR